MKIETISTDGLTPYARNARTHSPEQINQIAASIKKFGFTNPILIDNNNMIIAGHGRLLAAKQLQMIEVPVIRLEHLNPTQVRALIIADNKIALNAGWNEELLQIELGELKDLEVDLESLGCDMGNFPEFENMFKISKGNTDKDDEVPEPPTEPITKRGDIWQLGKHRLMCGDSTMIDDVKRLMNGQIAGMVFTDPPYNVNYRIAPTSTVSFVLPAITDNTIFHQILVQVSLTANRTINLGTISYIGGNAPTFGVGDYSIFYEHDGTKWNVGSVFRGVL